MNRATGEGKVDYDFGYFWSSGLSPWEKQYFPPAGTMGIIRLYNFDVGSAVVKHGHIVGLTWLGLPLLQQSVRENNDLISIIGVHSNTGDRKFNFELAKARAASVAGMLVDHGIPQERMDVIGGHTLDRDSKGEVERWRAVSILFTAMVRPFG